MGRNLFVKEEFTDDSNSNFIHQKREKNEKSNLFPEAVYLQEDLIDIELEVQKMRSENLDYLMMTDSS